MSVARRDLATVTLANGKVLIVGGFDGTNVLLADRRRYTARPLGSAVRETERGFGC
jgi:hypothetical protein